MKKKDIIHYLLIIVIVIFIRTFIVTPIRVQQSSMYPTLKQNDIMILNKISKKIKRFDIVVFKRQNEFLIKRVIGLPNEIVKYEDNILTIENCENIKDKQCIIEEKFITSDFSNVIIPEDYYFVLGDNRSNSVDSREFGVVHKSSILGKTNLIIFPFQNFKLVK